MRQPWRADAPRGRRTTWQSSIASSTKADTLIQCSARRLSTRDTSIRTALRVDRRGGQPHDLAHRHRRRQRTGEPSCRSSRLRHASRSSSSVWPERPGSEPRLAAPCSRSDDQPRRPRPQRGRAHGPMSRREGCPIPTAAQRQVRVLSGRWVPCGSVDCPVVNTVP